MNHRKQSIYCFLHRKLFIFYLKRKKSNVAIIGDSTAAQLNWIELSNFRAMKTNPQSKIKQLITSWSAVWAYRIYFFLLLISLVLRFLISRKLPESLVTFLPLGTSLSVWFVLVLYVYRTLSSCQLGYFRWRFVTSQWCP